MGNIYVLEAEAIEALLRDALVGRIACCAPDVTGTIRPYIVPIAYGYDGYDGDAVYAFSSAGRKVEMMRSQPLVQFQVDAAISEDRWQSVIADGTFEELGSDEGRDLAHRVIFGERAEIPPFGPEHVVYRIVLTAKAGRYELPDGEQPPYRES